MVEDIRRLLKSAKFGLSCPAQAIGEAEKLLGHSLPGFLKALYPQFDGFREGLGNAQYLFPLLQSSDGGTSLIEMTMYYRKDHTPPPDFSGFVFFGSSGGDAHWGVGLETDSPIIAYHHNMGKRYEIAGTDVIQVYLDDQKAYGTEDA